MYVSILFNIAAPSSWSLASISFSYCVWGFGGWWANDMNLSSNTPPPPPQHRLHFPQAPGFLGHRIERTSHPWFGHDACLTQIWANQKSAKMCVLTYIWVKICINDFLVNKLKHQQPLRSVRWWSVSVFGGGFGDGGGGV